MPGPAVALETTAPGVNRRRTWAHPELASHSLLVLTFERLHLAPLAGPPKPEVVAAVEAGADLDAVLGPLAVVIDLVAVRRLHLDLDANTIVVEYAGAGLGTSRVRVTFATPEAADACFTKVWRRLGDGLRLTPHRPGGWALARGPLILLAGALLVTAAVVSVLSVVEDTASGRGPGVLPAWLGWKTVCGLGGAAAAASQVWLYRRLTTPPAGLELVRQ